MMMIDGQPIWILAARSVPLEIWIVVHGNYQNFVHPIIRG